MQVGLRRIWAATFLIGWLAALHSPVAHAQGMNGQSLGGYGASWTSAAAGMGNGGMIVPYSGQFAGFMPYRSGGSGGGLSFSSGRGSMNGLNRTPFRLSSMSSGSSMTSASMGPGLGKRTLTTGSLGMPARMGSGNGMGQTLRGGGSSVMPPNFGYPFYQPPSLLMPDSASFAMSSM